MSTDSDTRRFRPRRILWLGFLLWVIALSMRNAWGETAFVTDQGAFNLRSGESTRHKILRMLPSGTEVEILGKDRDSGYSEVRLADGTSGFILSRYLQDEPAARARLEVAEQRLEELQQEPDQLAAKLSRIEEEHARLKEQFDIVSQRNLELEEELAELEHTSANVVNINEERNQLQQSVARLTRTVGELEQENLELRSRDDQHWFMTGAGVAGGGLLIGLLVPRLGSRRRRGSWGSI